MKIRKRALSRGEGGKVRTFWDRQQANDHAHIQQRQQQIVNNAPTQTRPYARGTPLLVCRNARGHPLSLHVLMEEGTHSCGSAARRDCLGFGSVGIGFLDQDRPSYALRARHYDGRKRGQHRGRWLGQRSDSYRVRQGRRAPLTEAGVRARPTPRDLALEPAARARTPASSPWAGLAFRTGSFISRDLRLRDSTQDNGVILDWYFGTGQCPMRAGAGAVPVVNGLSLSP